jgi:hypothetical protein
MKVNKITVCGGGNGAQTLAAIAAHNLGCAVDVYTPFGDEAKRLQAGVLAHGGLETVGVVQIKSWPRRISANPAEVIPGSDLVVLVLPAFAHESMLGQIAPFLDREVWVGAVPARGGFDYCAARILQEHGQKNIVLFGLQTLPWACRIRQYGKAVHVLGVKCFVDAATRPAGQIDQVAPLLQRMLGLPIGSAGNFFALTLANTGQLIHPGIMYGLFAGWDGIPFDEAPPFYQGLDEAGARVLSGLSDEIQAIRASLDGALDLSAVRPLKDWLLRSYGEAIADPSSLRSAFASNHAYAGLVAPVRKVVPGKFVPDFHARYLAEDVPFGLAVSLAIARLAGVATPTMERVIAWAGSRLGKDYLNVDADEARTPQKYRLETLEQLIDFTTEVRDISVMGG